MKKKRKNRIPVTGEIPRRAGIKLTLSLIAILMLSFLLPLNTSAQCAVKHDGFRYDERVTYELELNWKFVWTTAGKAVLSLNKSTYNNKPAYELELLVVGNKKADFFYKIRDTITSVVSEKLEPLYYRKGAIEGKRYWVDEAWFSYRDGTSFVNQKRTHADGKFDEYEYSDSRCIYDLLSVITWARTMDMNNFTEGERIDIPVSTGRRVDEQTLIFRGREPFKASNGLRYNCLVFSLVEAKGKKDNEVVTFFVTDDRNRLPIKLDLFLKMGMARASVKEILGINYPFTSIITD